jgi:hypothetical protein
MERLARFCLGALSACLGLYVGLHVGALSQETTLLTGDNKTNASMYTFTF